ncbi:HAD-IA family hydrolase [Paraglaciecola aquimarina]|uniref:HAD-IA family hydrolase n=1 Tax=Paraglaciecola algarum TaxID=3050085 RepID=A0ABS9D275_9ALTE|nr:HAD-IA family hydrolase [Paraglaciecola sp. G1-23]MCF2947022.1 HAD-IA family hydrolase [Paraglaciecola sp. G1-23]
MLKTLTQGPNAVLFDLDGTLLDTARDLGNALNHVLTQCDLAMVKYDQYRNIASDGAKGLLELGFAEKLKDYNFSILRQELLDYYQKNICVDTCYFEGIETLLKELDTLNIPWGIVTNKPEFLTLELVSFFPQLRDCQVVISGDSLAERKPHPLPLLEAEKRLKLANPNTWYLGDAERDIQAANAANMTSVAALYGYIDKSINVDSWQANIKIENPTDILAYL